MGFFFQEITFQLRLSHCMLSPRRQWGKYDMDLDYSSFWKPFLQFISKPFFYLKLKSSRLGCMLVPVFNKKQQQQSLHSPPFTYTHTPKPPLSLKTSCQSSPIHITSLSTRTIAVTQSAKHGYCRWEEVEGSKIFLRDVAALSVIIFKCILCYTLVT